MVDMPNLDRLVSVAPGDTHIVVTVLETREDRDGCQDGPDCTQAHRWVNRHCSYKVEHNAANLAALGEHFFALALGHHAPVTLSTDATAAEQLAREVYGMNVTNIAGASRYEQDMIQAVAPGVVRTIHRLADTIDTAATGDSIAADQSWMPSFD